MKFTTATVIAFVAAVSADYVPEPEYPVEPTYPVDPPVYTSTKEPEYPSSADPVYPTYDPAYPSADPVYPTTTPCTTSTDYPVYPTTTLCTTSSGYPVYPSKSAEYPEYPKYPVSKEDKYPVVSYTTKVVDQYTTYCPYPTTYVHEGKEYPVTTVSSPS